MTRQPLYHAGKTYHDEPQMEHLTDFDRPQVESWTQSDGDDYGIVKNRKNTLPDIHGCTFKWTYLFNFLIQTLSTEYKHSEVIKKQKRQA